MDIRELAEGMQIEGFYACKESSLRETRGGKQYIRLTLGDASGDLTANVWQKTEDEYADIAEQYGAVAAAETVKIRAQVESYQDRLQLKILRIRPAEADEVDLAELMPRTPMDRGELEGELRNLLAGIGDADYAALAKSFLEDEPFLRRFCEAPAARSNHHAYLGGLLEHTVSVLRICQRYCDVMPELRRDLMLLGGFLHDVGKVEELRGGVAIEYTDEGSLLGHLTQGILMIEAKLDDLPDLPREKRNLIYHLILSHHGRHEYGSPVLPKIPEAFALHHIDNLDAKVYAASRLIRDDPNVEGSWTERSWMLETRLFKG
jgi:3'-5' exoribonuclease